MSELRGGVWRWAWPVQQDVGGHLFYSEDEDNCTVMAFDSNMPNPNFGLSLGAAGAPKFEGTVALSGLLALMALVIFEQ